MPRVVISFDAVNQEYSVYPVDKDYTPTEYEAVVHMKSSSYREIVRTELRWLKHQDFLEKFFVEAQMAGRNLSER